jgi:hypothetical protein
MSNHLLSMEAKLDDLMAEKDDTTIKDILGGIIIRIDHVEKAVEERIDEQGLAIATIRRAMEKMQELRKREEELVRNVNKNLARFEIMLRRILGFHQDFGNLSSQLSEVGKNVNDLLLPQGPRDDNSSTEDDDETKTQYNNNEGNYERLGNGPLPMLFTAPIGNPLTNVLTVPTASSITPQDKIKMGTTVPTGPASTGTTFTGTVAPTSPIVESAVGSTVIPSPAPITTFVPPISQDPSPDITMTPPTPLNSQDQGQDTTTVSSSTNLVPPPNEVPPSPGQASQVPVTNPKGKGRPPAVGERRSPRIRGDSRAPTPATELPAKRHSQDDEEVDPKCRKVMPS